MPCGRRRAGHRAVWQLVAELRLFERSTLRAIFSAPTICAAAVLMIACGPDGPQQPDLPKQDDRWVSTVVLDADSVATYVGKTRDYVITDSSEVRDVKNLKTVNVGDEIQGVRIGAIRCSFFWKDASYDGEQFMWRGRWGCQAGRNQQEVLNAVDKDGAKLFDYISISPVRLSADE